MKNIAKTLLTAVVLMLGQAHAYEVQEDSSVRQVINSRFNSVQDLIGRSGLRGCMVQIARYEDGWRGVSIWRRGLLDLFGDDSEALSGIEFGPEEEIRATQEMPHGPIANEHLLNFAVEQGSVNVEYISAKKAKFTVKNTQENTRASCTVELD